MSHSWSPWNNIDMLMNSKQGIRSLLLKEHTELHNQHQNIEAYGWLREMTTLLCPKAYSFLSVLTVNHKSRGNDFSKDPQERISTCTPERYNGSAISPFAQIWGLRLLARETMEMTKICKIRPSFEHLIKAAVFQKLKVLRSSHWTPHLPSSFIMGIKPSAFNNYKQEVVGKGLVVYLVKCSIWLISLFLLEAYCLWNF